MAEPARKLDNDFEPGGGPAWQPQVIEGGGESTPERANLSVAPDSPTDFYNPVQSERAALGLTKTDGDKAADSERKAVAGDQDFMDNSEPQTKSGGRFSFVKKHKKGFAGGGIAGLVLGGGFGLFIFFSGPLEFIHLAQLMQQFHFSDNEDVNDSQLTRFYRWMRWKDKPGNRRLSEIGNKMADKLQVRFEEAGWHFDLDERGYLRGFDIDIEKAQAHNVDVDGLAAEVGGEISEGKLRVNIDPGNPFKYLRNKKLVKESRKAIRETGAVSALEGNKIGKRGGFTRHPIRALDSTVREKGIDAIKSAWRKLRGEKLSGEATPTTIKGTDEDKNPDTTNEGEQQGSKLNEDIHNAEPDVDGRKAGSLSKKIFTATALITAYCMAKDLADGASEEQWQQIGMGSEIMSSYYQGLGNQVEASQDIDLDQLGFEKDLLYDKSNDNNPDTQPSSWVSADTIQKLIGNAGGVALSGAYTLHGGQNILSEILGNVPGVVAGGLDTACSAANSWLGQAIQFGVGFVTGPVSTLTSEGLSRAFGSDVVNFLTRLLTGEGLPLDLAGAQLGGVIDQGSAFLSSQELLARGGEPLSPAQKAEVKHYLADQDRQEFQSQSFARRLFALRDQRSLVAKSYYELPHNVGSAIAGIFGLPQSAMKGLAHLVSLPAYAVDETAIDYGVPTISFPLSERSSFDDSHDNPYENLDALLKAQVSVGPNETVSYLAYNNDYANLDEKCFGLQLNTADDSFEVTSLPRLDTYGQDGDPTKDCIRDDDLWQRYRQHIANVMTATEVACYEDDSEACTELGYGSAATPAAAGSSSKIVGDPYTDTTGVPCADGTKDLGIQDGYVDGKLFPVRLCSLTNLPSSGEIDNQGTSYSIPGADGHAIVNSRVSGAWFALVSDAKAAGVDLSATSSFRTNALQQVLWGVYGHDPQRVAQPGYSSHQAGTAIDFAGMSGFVSGANCASRASDPSSPGWVWMRDNASKYGFKQYADEAWHWDALLSTTRCG